MEINHAHPIIYVYTLKRISTTVSEMNLWTSGFSLNLALKDSGILFASCQEIASQAVRVI